MKISVQTVKVFKSNEMLLHQSMLFTLSFIVSFSSVWSCKNETYYNEYTWYSCSTADDLITHGTEEWINVELYNSSNLFNVTKDLFKNTPNLEQITVGPVANIERGVFHTLKNLHSISIYVSNLEEIRKEDIDGLSLTSLHITSGIRKIAKGFFDNLPKIEEVIITFNNLKEIEKGIFNNTPIIDLVLNGNKLETIQDCAFFGMKFLKILMLKYNYLKSFDAQKLLGEPSGLLELYLQDNHLNKINLLNLLKSLPELYFLDISSNRLKEVQPNTFPQNGSMLEILFIHNNRLTFLNKEIFQRNANLKYVSYGGNPFQCSCLEETKDLTIKNNITRLCDVVYFSGHRTVCVDLNKNKCIYDVELTKNLFVTFRNSSKDYIKLASECDSSDELNNINMRDIY